MPPVQSVLVLLLWEFALVNDYNTGINNTFSELKGDGNQARSSSMLKDKIRTHFKWIQVLLGFFKETVALSNCLTGLSQLSSDKPVFQPNPTSSVTCCIKILCLVLRSNIQIYIHSHHFFPLPFYSKTLIFSRHIGQFDRNWMCSVWYNHPNLAGFRMTSTALCLPGCG